MMERTKYTEEMENAMHGAALKKKLVMVAVRGQFWGGISTHGIT